MQSLWNDQKALGYSGDLAQRVYTSRLLGRDKSLVLHGGGNTSVKILETNLFGREELILYVKGSGWDLETIEPAGFSPVRLAPLLELATLDSLSDTQMVNELRLAMTNSSAPTPSVEAILHAALPSRYVDHTHADAILSITNTADGEQRIREIYGEAVIIIPYVMPGFKLARLVAERFPAEATDKTVGMVLLKHGIFTFGDTARESYERMIELVSRAEEYLQAKGAWEIKLANAERSENEYHGRARLRSTLSKVAGSPVILASHHEPLSIAFANHDNVDGISQQGPATPDHVLRTKRLPLVGQDVEAYAAAYQVYFGENAARAENPLTMLDASPRIILDAELGMMSIGRTAKEAAIAAEIYEHTMQIILRAEALGGYEALPAGDIFDVEYWELEQAKLRHVRYAPFAGQIALVTGAASGIGKACADSLMARGAAVVGLDINPVIETLWERPDFLGVQCDVSDETAIKRALEQALEAFGGLDMLILNAGIFPASSRIEALKLSDWDRVMRINLDANLVLMREAHALLKLASRGGRVVIVGSKNVPAPGPGQAAYSASKAALTQLARVAALEWGGDGIRVNVVHPNAVFDTGIWSEDVLSARAQNYGLTVEQYKTNNVLHVEVTSHDVGELVADLCGSVFSRTTGAQIPIDGGNDRVI